MKIDEPDLAPDRPPALEWDKYRDWLESAWNSLLASDPHELEVQSFLETHPVLLPGALGDIGPGGHHGPELSAVFRQPPLRGLNKDRVPDFMWITRATALITPICIEIERPSKNWFNLDGTPTAALAQALDQLTDWKVWFSEPENESIFRKTYLRDDYSHRAFEPQYLLIYGREREFTISYGRHKCADRMRKKRDFMRRANEQFMTFDSLKPTSARSNFVTLTMTVDGPQLHGVPPTFTTGPSTSELAATVRDPSAIMRTPLLSDERKAYVVSRWIHWQSQADDSGEMRMRSLRLGE